MRAVRHGTSWSGNERNRCLLNLSGKQFADASSISGLDFSDDGRAMAVCDWNRDGKLDLWLRNRTAPRLRLMINHAAGGESVAIRLQGVKCNRDGIGAVVEMTHHEKPLIRSLRAGEMFLSQSSKWLHFGLGKVKKKKEPGEITVHWPGGEKEIFQGIKSGGRYLLKQGSGTAKVITAPAPVPMRSQEKKQAKKQAGVTNIRLPIAVPLPTMAYRNATAKPQKMQPIGRPQLLIIWESSCAICEGDLKTLEANREIFSKAGIGVLALAADSQENTALAYKKIDDTSYSGTWGIADPRYLLSLWKWQAAWFDRRPAASVPFACLVDGQGNCLALYRGGIEVDSILKDARALIGIDPRTRWHLAPPLSGSWFTNPLPRDYVWKSIGDQMRAEGRTRK